MDNPNIPVFLSAEWRRLLNLTYAVDADLLAEYLPKSTEPDLYHGKAHVSFVAFEFLNTKVKGIRIPFHVNFPEINLRYYVRYGDHLGVAFVKELVPKFCIALVARKLYNEPYFSLPMQSSFEVGDSVSIHHRIKHQGKLLTVKASAPNKPYMAAEDTATHYFKEHDLGFGTDLKGRSVFYRVQHPWWEAYPLDQFDLNFDFGAVYGQKWAFLRNEQPAYSVLAEGSPITVSHPRILKDFAQYESLFQAPMARY